MHLVDTAENYTEVVREVSRLSLSHVHLLGGGGGGVLLLFIRHDVRKEMVVVLCRIIFPDWCSDYFRSGFCYYSFWFVQLCSAGYLVV